jgi:hypothetical protein
LINSAPKTSPDGSPATTKIEGIGMGLGKALYQDSKLNDFFDKVARWQGVCPRQCNVRAMLWARGAEAKGNHMVETWAANSEGFFSPATMWQGVCPRQCNVRQCCGLEAQRPRAIIWWRHGRGFNELVHVYKNYKKTVKIDP